MVPPVAASPWGDNSRWLAQRAQGKRRNKALFAEALANSTTGTVSEAARAVGISQQTGSIYFREICRDINGPQRAAGYEDWTT